MDRSLSIISAFFSDPFGIVSGYIFFLIIHVPLWFLLRIKSEYSLIQWAGRALLFFIVIAAVCGLTFTFFYIPFLFALKVLGLIEGGNIPIIPFLYFALSCHAVAQLSLYYFHFKKE